MTDPTIWTNRAKITVDVAVWRTLDAGVPIHEVENVVRGLLCPFHPQRHGGEIEFSPALVRAYKVWVAALDAEFVAPKRSRRGGRGDGE